MNKVKSFKMILMSTFVLLSCACGSMGTGSNDRTSLKANPNLVPESEYYSLIEKNSQNQVVYDGLANVLNTSATLMTSQLLMAQVDHNARVFQYNDSQYLNEQGTAKSNLSKQTEVFISLFVPDRKFDDLAKKTTHWKIFLDVAGQRYEAKVIKIKSQFAEVQSLYPNHTRWGTPYKLIFPVSTSISENAKPVLTLTGPLASTTLEFKSE